MVRRKYRFTRREILNGWEGAKEPCVMRWLGKLQRKQMNAYLLFLFCDWAGRHNGWDGEFSPQALLDMKEDRNCMDAEYLLDDFVSDTICPEFTNSMKWSVVQAVRSFFMHSYRSLEKASGRISMVKKKPYRKHTEKELLDIYRRGCYNPRDRSLVTFVFSTAICRETIPYLTWAMIEDGEDGWEHRDIPHIGIPDKYLKGHGIGRWKGVEQHTFLTPEAKRDLITYREWVQRNKRITLRKNSPIFVSLHPPYEALDYDHLGTVARSISERSGIPVSWHDARRYVQTGLEEAKLDPNWMRKIRGRKVRGEENPYSRPAIEKLRNAYREAVPYLVFVEPALAEERVHEEVRTVMRAHEIEREELRREIGQMRTRMEERPIRALEKFGRLLDQDPEIEREFLKWLQNLRNVS